MFRSLSRIGLALAFVTLAALPFSAMPANAVVYCKTVGVPKGCVARPTGGAVVYCKRVGVPKGCVMR
jgi:hypothetical protein